MSIDVIDASRTQSRSPAAQPDHGGSLERRARRAGALYLLLLIVGLFSMFGFNGFIVTGDATATARNIMAADTLYRVGILTDFVCFIVFIVLVTSLYSLLEGVDKWHAMLMVLLVSFGVALGLANLLNKIAPLLLLGGAGYLSGFTQSQLNGLALAFLELNDRGNTIDGVFWGLWLLPFGMLVIKSRFLPRVLGILLLAAGFGYVTSSITALVLPAYGDVVSRVMMPLLFGEFPIIFWLLIKGAKLPQSPSARSPTVPVPG